MALTEKEIADTLRLKDEVEANLRRVHPLKEEMERNLQRMQPLLERQFPVAHEALRLEEQWRQILPPRSLVEELARGHEEMSRIAATPSLAEEMGRTARQLEAAGVLTASARLSEEYTRMAPMAVSIVSGLQAAVSAFEGSSILKAARAFENSPILAAARAFDNSAVVQLAKALSDNPLLDAARAFDGGIVAQLARGFENLGPLNLNAALATQFAGMREVVLSPQFHSFVEEARASESFVERMVANAVALAHDDDDDEPLAAVAAAFTARAATLPRGTLSFETMVSLLAILLAVVMYLRQGQDTAELKADVSALRNDREQYRQTFVAGAEELRACLAPLSDQNEKLAVVFRPLNVRLAPEVRAQRVATLEAGQQVNVLGRADTWLHVEYFDADSCALKSGWIAARWTKEVTKE